jgi:hypothetical protein
MQKIPNIREAAIRDPAELADLCKEEALPIWDTLSTKLESLVIRVHDRALVNSMPKMHQLAELELTSVSREDFELIVPKVPKLKVLRVHFGGFSQFSFKQPLEMLVTYCPLLEHVELSSSVTLYAADVEAGNRIAPLLKLKKLKTVVLSGGEANAMRDCINAAYAAKKSMQSVESAVAKMWPSETAHLLERLEGVNHYPVHLVAAYDSDILSEVMAKYPPRELNPTQLLDVLRIMQTRKPEKQQEVVRHGVDLYAPVESATWPRACLLHVLVCQNPALLANIFSTEKTIDYDGSMLSCIEYSRRLHPHVLPSMWNSLWCCVAVSKANEDVILAGWEFLTKNADLIVALTDDANLLGSATTANAWGQCPIDLIDSFAGNTLAETLLNAGAKPSVELAARLIRHPQTFARCLANDPSLVDRKLGHSNQPLLIFVLKQYYSSCLSAYLDSAILLLGLSSAAHISKEALDAIESIFSDFVRRDPSVDSPTEPSEETYLSLFRLLDTSRLKKVALANLKLAQKTTSIADWALTELCDKHKPAFIVADAICEVELDSLSVSNESLLLRDAPRKIVPSQFGLKLIQIASKSSQFAQVLAAWSSRGHALLPAFAEYLVQRPVDTKLALATLSAISSAGGVSSEEMQAFRESLTAAEEEEANLGLQWADE